MQYSEFIGKVQNMAGLPSEDEAVKITRVTLQTLGSRLAGNESKHIADQLPSEIGRFLTERESGRRTESFSLNEFYQRVAERTGADEPAARHHCRAVMSVLRNALSPGEIEDIKAQLPDEFDSLLNPPDVGPNQPKSRGKRTAGSKRGSIRRPGPTED